jgi:hypothetical protein
VSIAALLTPEFLARPDELFSADRFHPNGAGYELASSVLLAPLCDAVRHAQGSGVRRRVASVVR